MDSAPGKRGRIGLLVGITTAVAMLATIALALIGSLSPLTQANAAQAAAADGRARVPKPVLVVDRDTRCVAPPDEIRRNHMDMLKHQRDRTSREGVRGAKVSLNACIACHATPLAAGGRKPGAPAMRTVVGGPEAFCQGCHDYAGVTLDCFECHQPRVAARGGAAPAAAGKAQ